MVYDKQHQKRISFPLGGIGTGCIGLAGNGALVDWEIFNRPDKNSFNGYSHFAVRAFDNGKPVDARVLIGDREDGYDGGDNIGFGMDTRTLQGFPHFSHCTFSGEFPVAEISFSEPAFPGEIRLTAFNPLIPLDSQSSSIPAAFFELSFYNTTDSEIDYQAALSVCNPFARSVNTGFGDGITFFDAEDGENSLTLLSDAERIQTQTYWYRGSELFRDGIRTFCNEFFSGEQLSDRRYDEPGHKDTGSLMAAVTVAPGKTGRLRFVLSWSIPYCRNYWFPKKDENGNDVRWKNYYATVFDSSRDSARYSLENWSDLYEKTEVFRKALFSQTIPAVFAEAAASSLAVLKSPTVWRLENGDFYGFEGVGKDYGSCEGTCQHVWNYAYALCYLFPDLERSIRNNEFRYCTEKSGEMQMRIALPLGREEYVNLYENNGKKFRACLDGQMGAVIKTYREWQLSGDDDWLRSIWDTVKAVLLYANSPDNPDAWDPDSEGVLKGRQHNTLDIELFGPSAWLEGFYLAALQAGRRMAEYLGDSAFAGRCSALFEKGYRWTADNLFNGEYFIQKVDLKDPSVIGQFGCAKDYWNDERKEIKYQIGEGCLIDQLCAQWHSELMGLGDIFDPRQVKTAAIHIFKNNFKDSFRDFANPWRLFSVNDEQGTVLCAYPHGTQKPFIPIPYGEETMAGFEYVLAGLLLCSGYPEEAQKVVCAVRNKYDGEKRNPYNEMECGSNYARSMAAFALLPLSAGFTASLPTGTLRFCPRYSQEEYSYVFFTATGWGCFSGCGGKLTLRIKSGYLSVEKLSIPLVKSVRSVKIDGVETKFTFCDGSIRFSRVRLTNTLEIS